MSDIKYLRPFKMYPAYRYGKATPWGGDSLARLFGRKLPSDKTGESLEVSALDGLSSTNANGETLLKLIDRYGERLVGDYAGKPFPLLLKLISARDRLSVQVHPDDAYAKKHENKLGKTEAWIILDAAENAEIVYGLSPGVTKDMLLNAFTQDTSKIPGLLRYVKVKKGDAFFMPSGAVHAIGAGITIYEIQQSSDVTYRFYDWDRVDAKGNKRELHIEKALDVSDLSFAEYAVTPMLLPLKNGKLEKLFSGEYFSTCRYTSCNRSPLPSFDSSFAMVTCIEKGELCWQQDFLPLNAGDTAFIPAKCYPLEFTGGHMLLSTP